jgi:hypothetical protein
MARPESPLSEAGGSRLEREIERERNERSLNHDARAHLTVEEDERHKDARKTSFSSTVRR